MHVGKAYRVYEFFSWTRRSLFALVLVSVVAMLLYHLVGFKGASLPWSVVLLLGTTVALVSGFKNTQIYNRSLDAQQAWSAISTSSRLWGTLCRDFLTTEPARKIIYSIAVLFSHSLAERVLWPSVDRAAPSFVKR